MNINIKTTNMDLTPAISDYIHDKLQTISKVIKNPDEVHIHIEVGKTTEHHKQGEDLFKAEINLSVDGEKFTVTDRDADLYAAIDLAKDNITRDIKKAKNRSRDLFIRGARSLKKRLKGLKPW